MKNRLIYLFLILSTSLVQGQDCLPIGMNLLGLNTHLVDVFKCSRPFFEGEISGEWDTGYEMPKDANGYVTSIRDGYVARTLFLETVDGHYPAGIYTMYYDGEGEIDIWGDGVIISETDNGGDDNIILIEVLDPAYGIYLDILTTNPTNYIRDIRVIRPSEGGVDYTEIYESEYIVPAYFDLLKNYSFIRFMDWLGTNYSVQEEWEDRPQLSWAHWEVYEGGRGVPIEVMTYMANKLEADPWFCLPHKADDDYVTQFAQLVSDQLDPDRSVYVEYSNEVWNDFFRDVPDFDLEGQNSYALEMAEANGITGYFEQIGYWVGRRSGEIWDIWDAVFSGSERLLKVIPIQVGPDLATPITLNYEHNGIPIHEIGDVVACAPYFDGFYQELDLDDTTVDELLDALESDMTAFDSGPYWAEQTVNLLQSAQYSSSNLELIAYEGGQHLWNPAGDPDDPVTALLIEANRHPRMGELYTQYLDWWEEMGGGAFALFGDISIPNAFGSWGIMEHLDQDTLESPKWLAVQDWIRNQDCLTTSNYYPFGKNDNLITFPTPTSDWTFVEITEEVTDLKIVNSLGQIIKSVSWTQENSLLKIPVHTLSQDMYFVVLHTDRTTYTVPILIAN